MQVLVTKTQMGSPDGTTVHEYMTGKTYGPTTNPPMPLDLSAVLVREGWGEEVVAKALPAAPEDKMLGGAGENKADGAAGAPAVDPDDQPDAPDADAGEDGAPDDRAEADVAETDSAAESEGGIAAPNGAGLLARLAWAVGGVSN